MRKYHLLGDYLLRQHEITATLTFQAIEEILGFALPPSAHRHRAWWANSLSHPQAVSWLNVGWKVSNTNLETKTVFLIRPLILTINKNVVDSEELSLEVSINADNLVFILSGPSTTASTAYPWRQIVQMLIDANPHLFGYLTNQPMHYIFPEMLAKLGYTVVNWETGESWEGQKGKDTMVPDD